MRNYSGLHIVYFLILALFCGQAQAQEQEQVQEQVQEQEQQEQEVAAADDLAWLNTFRSFASNSQSISIPLTAKNIERIKRRLSLYQYQILYVSVDELRNKAVPSLRIGFYSLNNAIGLKKDSDFIFPEQKIVNVSLPEHQGVLAALDDFASEGKQNKKGRNLKGSNDYFVFPIGPNASGFFDLMTEDMLASAKKLYVEKKYAEAEIHYQLLSMIALDPEIAAWGKELLGVCQEKQKQFGEAIETYRQLQLEYPESNGFNRIEQRLRGLTTAASDRDDSLRKSSYEGNDRKVFTRGFFGQYYRSLSRAVNDGESEEVNAFLTTQFDVRSSTENTGYVLKARINGTHIADQLEDEGSDLRLKRLLVEYQHRPTGTIASFGRQKKYDSGVFTSFDGVSASYPVLSSVRVALSLGKPVYYSGLFEELDYFFYSTHVSWDAGERWRFNSYLINQTLNGVVDRQAIGLRSQYFDTKLSSSLNVDYDMAFAELNNLLWTSNYKLNKKTYFTLNYGQQRSPFLTASNIFIGQPDLDLELYLRTQANEDTLLDDALARTSLNQYVTLSASRNISKDIDINIDFTQSALSDIPSTSLLLGDTSLENDSADLQQTSIGAQLISKRTLSSNDVLTFGLRSTSSNTSDSLQLYLNERFRIGNSWAFVPKLSFTQSTTASDNTKRNTIRYSLAMTYRPWRGGELNLELGNESLNETSGDDTIDSTYLFAGYRIIF